MTPRHDITISITGPTASGKTRRAVDVARALDGEIISADSRQVYRGMDIGSGKDLGEYGEVPYHLIDVADPGEKFNLCRYLDLYHEAIAGINSRGKTPVVCGGTGLYLESALSGMRMAAVPENPQLRQELRDKPIDELARILASMKRLHNVTDLDTAERAIRAIEIQTYLDTHPEAAEAARRRPADNAIIIGVDIPRDIRRARITARLHERLDSQDMLGEIRRLLDAGTDPDTLISYGLEYRYLTLHLLGRLTYDEMVAQLQTAIHQFAKRQLTWFRGMERRGFTIHWLPYDMPSDEFVARVAELIPDR